MAQGGVEINGATAPLHSIAAAANADAGIYTVRVSNDHGSTLSEPAELRVGVPVNIVSQPADQNATVGSTIKLEVEASGPIR